MNCHALRFIFALLLAFALRPAEAAPAAQSAQADSVKVSLITCFPGEEVYALCGHEAIRIRTAESDSVWNYGIFDFHEPNFIYRFVKGETDYRLAGYPFAWFMPEYISRGSTVVEQDLNLSPGEAIRLRDMLRTEALPQNCKYRYNYIKDNCATRIVDRIDSVAGGAVRYPDASAYRTWRDAMRHYHSNYPWYQFGIDLALGSGLDVPMKERDDMFVPMVMMDKADRATMPDGRKLVSARRTLFEGSDSAVLPPTPFWLSPLFAGIVIFGASLIFASVSLFRKRLYNWVYTLWFGILGLAGCVIAFLVFVSEHEATSPNLLLLWLNPLQLVFPLFIWSWRTRFLCKALSVVDSVVMLSLLILWPMQSQSANIAFFPLMGATLVMAASYAIISLIPSYNISGSASKPVTRKAPAKRSRSKRR